MRVLTTLLLIALSIIAATVIFSKESQKQLFDPILLAPPAGGRSALDRNSDDPLEAVSSLPPGTSLRWYGFYDPFSGAAVEGDMWTFDHGALDPLEGWTTNDSTENDFVAWRRITPGIWSGHGNIPSAPISAGTGSVWMGFFEDEAAHVGFEAGLGYGNGWCQQMRTPGFVSGSGSATLSFDYFYDMELFFDTLHVILEQGGSRTPIAAFSGKSGSPGSPVHFSQSMSPVVLDTFNILFEFRTDMSYSDQDSLYTTDLSAFGMDNVDLQGSSLTTAGPSPPYDFEADMSGFIANACEGVGTFLGVNDIAFYSLASPGCGMSGNVIELHDASYQHPGRQEEMIRSPSVPLPQAGGPFNVFADYDAFGDLDLSAITPWNNAWSYYPWVCPVCADSTWSPPEGMGTNYVGTTDPPCFRFRSFATDTASGQSVWGSGKLVPDDADSVRFFLHISNWTNNVAAVPAPLFDNIRVGVSNRATMLHVPSPTYTTIQSAINVADEGDTVLVRSGVYTGAGNKDLYFTGLNIVLMSEDGPEATVIDCEGMGRAMEILTAQDTSTMVIGFTFRNGDGAGADGGGVYVDAPVIFADCVFDSNSTNMIGGGASVFGSARFLGCRFMHNSSSDQGGGVSVMWGDPVFVDCYFEKNDAAVTGGGVAVGGGNPQFFNCYVDSNTTPIDGGGVYINGGTPIFEGCHIRGNDALLNGGGVFAIGTAGAFFGCEISFNTTFQYGAGVMNYGDIELHGCDILENNSVDAGGGVYIAGGSPMFDACQIRGNFSFDDGGGVVVTGSSAATFSGCLIGGNDALLNGGGIFVYSADPLFFECEISGNETMSNGTWGGGVMATSGSFIQCDIVNNVSNANGGGISVPFGAPSFQDCLIAGNDAAEGGGGIAVSDTSAPDFVRCVITGNRAQYEGGGVLVEMESAAPPGFTGCTIADNYAGGGGGGGLRVVNDVVTPLTLELSRTIVWGNCSAGPGAQVFVTSNPPDGGVAFICSDVDSTGMDSDANGVILYVTDNIFENPWLCQPVDCSLAPNVAGDYTLRNASPCLASKSPCSQLIGALDGGCAATGVGGDEVASLPTEYSLLQNAPNPFNPVTRIAFEIPRSGLVQLSVYNVTGTLIRTLVNETLPRAKHTVLWDGSDESGRSVASGVYFYRLETAGFAETKKMMLLK